MTPVTSVTSATRGRHRVVPGTLPDAVTHTDSSLGDFTAALHPCPYKVMECGPDRPRRDVTAALPQPQASAYKSR